MKGFTEYEKAAALFSRKHRENESKIDEKESTTQPNLQTRSRSPTGHNFERGSRSPRNRYSDQKFHDSLLSGSKSLGDFESNINHGSRQRPSYSPYRGNSDFDIDNSTSETARSCLGKNLGHSINAPSYRRVDSQRGRSISRSRSRSRNRSRSRSSSRDRHNKSNKYSINPTLARQPPPPDPVYKDEDYRDKYHTRNSRRDRSRSNDRKKYMRKENDEQDDDIRWVHDKYSIDEPSIQKPPSGYRPPSPTWKSRAGGVAIMKRR